MARQFVRYPFAAFVPVPKSPPQPDAPTTGGSLAVLPRRRVRYEVLGFVALPPPPPSPPSAGAADVQARKFLRYQLLAWVPTPPPPPPPAPAAGPSALALASLRMGETNEALDRMLKKIRGW